MRGLVVGLVFLLCCSLSPAYGSALGGLVDDVIQETRITILESGQSGHFLDLTNGSSKASVSTSIFEYRFLHASVGWTNDLSGERIGDALGGGGISIDKLISQVMPDAKYLAYALLPKSAEKFWDHLYFTYMGGWSIDDGRFVHGINSGIQIKFRGR